MSSKIRLGIIGAGSIARLGHVPAIQQMPEVELIAICRRNKEKANEYGREWGVKEIYYDYMDLVRSKNIDAVIVTTPNSNHREAVVAAANEGKHVLCDKPIATNLKDAKEMVKACKENKVKFQMGFNQRFWNQVEIAKQLVEKDTIGQVMGFTSTFKVRVADYPSDTDYRFQTELSGGSTLIDPGVHRIDMARFFMGEIKEICAVVKHSVVPQMVDDNGWILCNFSSGATGFISSDIYSPTMDNTTALYGSEGTIYISTETVNPFQSVPLAVYTEKNIDQIPDIVIKYFYPKVWWDKPKDNWISIVPPRDFPYLKQLKAFYKSITEDKEPVVTGEDGVKSLEVVLAAYKSAREKSWVTLPLKEEVVELPI
jgi:predicted dehydrogenase